MITLLFILTYEMNHRMAIAPSSPPRTIITCPIILVLPCRLEATSAKFVQQAFLALPQPGA